MGSGAGRRTSDSTLVSSRRFIVEVARLIAAPLKIEIDIAQRRGHQEFSKRAFADGLARPFLGRDDDDARLAVAGNDLRIGLSPLDHLGQPRLGAGHGPMARTVRGDFWEAVTACSYDYND